MDLLLFHKLTAGFLYTFLILLYINAIYKIYQKNKFVLEPIHIFELNILVDMMVGMAVRCLTIYDIHFERVSFICNINHWVVLYTFYISYTDVIIAQIDRFLSLYWNLSYKAKVSTSRAMNVIVINKLVMVIPTALTAWVIKDALHCYNSQ